MDRISSYGNDTSAISQREAKTVLFEVLANLRRFPRVCLNDVDDCRKPSVAEAVLSLGTNRVDYRGSPKQKGTH